MTIDGETGPGGALDARSIELRGKILDVLGHSRRGHIGASFSLVEILRVLFDEFLRFDPANPKWPERDRFILSKGHGCLALYVLLAEKGFFPAEELARFCAFDGMLGGHPDARKIPGVETSTGSLGHGLPFGVGMALHGRMTKSRHRVYVVMGDGECDEGSVWEAALCAGKHRLGNLTVLVDYNKMQSYGTVAEVQELEPFALKWQIFGFHAAEVNGHDVVALRGALLDAARNPGRPTVLICHTVKGRGVKSAEGNLAWHHKSRISDDELALLRAELGG